MADVELDGFAIPYTLYICKCNNLFSMDTELLHINKFDFVWTSILKNPIDISVKD